jgi:hypothetical protein
MSDEISPDFISLIHSVDRFTAEQIDSIRRSLPISGNAATPLRLYTRDRLKIELLDALLRLDLSIRQLDLSSTKLVTTTNKLTKRMLQLTWVGVILGVVGVVLAVVQALHPRPL